MTARAVREPPAFVFDLDGTLIDSVYQHALAWREALESVGMELSVWRIHRRIGMSGGLTVAELSREIGVTLDRESAERLDRLHVEAFERRRGEVRPLPGAEQLLRTLTEQGVRWAIATSGRSRTARDALACVAVEPEILVTRDDVVRAKPEPDLFLAAAERLGVRPEESYVVGDSVWDLLAAQRARALGIGVLSGGYSRQELEIAGAFRVYEDPADILDHLDQLGVRG
jgi:HAD superfamily hydrolase (TIGR01509 family)